MSFLSVVVATYQRVESLRVTLDRLRDQTLGKDKYEVIVVDDGSPDHTAAMVSAYIRTGSLPLGYLRHESRGPGFTGNRGIREARGPWVLLLCGDMQPAPDTLAVHFQTHEQNPAAHIAVAGKVVQAPDLPDTVFHRHWDPFRYKALDGRAELTYLNFCGCHVSFKKQFMLDHGMFLERPVPSHEDIEAGWRLSRQGGMRLLYRPDALAYHYHPETIDSACRRAYERGCNFDVLCDRVDDPALYVRNHLVTRQTLPHVLRALRAPSPGVLDEDRNVVWFLLREGLRRLLFNRATVPYLLRPLIRQAERNRALALLVSPLLLRGVVSYHFLRGVAELRRRRPAVFADGTGR
jgi:glycosyltransferase involved in cell wall biosynthesis